MRFLVAGFILIQFLPLAASADPPVVFPTDLALRGTKPLSMGGAGRALSDDNSAIEFNPAGMSRIPRYGIELLFLSDPDVTSYRGSVVDSKTSVVGVGLSYTRNEVSVSGANDSRNDVTAAFSGALTQYASLGIAVRFLDFQGKYLSTFGAGAQVRPLGDWISLGVMFHDAVFLGGQNPGVHKKLSYGISSKLTEYLTLVADAGREQGAGASSPTDIAAGGEVTIAEQLKIRGGYAWENSLDRKFYTLGIGWVIPRISLEYGFRQDVRNTSDQTHSVSLSIYPL